MIGKTIAHYKILERIGAGGMGVVYKAEDIKLGRLVALKFLPPYALDSEEDRIRFTNEAQAAAALDHPNICTVHEINEVDGHHYIAMAYVDGTNLKERIRGGPLPIAEALDIAVQVAAGLKRAHEKGIVHRDIKPANILLATDGTAKICDFGLAKSGISKKVTRTGSTVGTAAYMSPEQARSEPVDHRTDIWSLGVILYEMLTGRPPFFADHEASVIYSILQEDYTPLLEHRPEAPPPVPDIVARALAKNPALRYQSMADVERDLKVAQVVAMAGPATAVAAPEPQKPSPKPMTSAEPKPAKKKSKGLFVGIGVVAILVLAVLAVMKFRGQSPSETAESTPPIDSSAAQSDTIQPPPAQAKAPPVPTIAVLYMENLGGDKAEDFFAAGMTEDIIVGLSNIRKLRVLSRQDVAKFRGQPLSVTDMGKSLKADYLLEGSVRREKKQLRMTVQLHKVDSAATVWAQRFDRPAQDVFKVQSEIADSVAAALAIQLSPVELQTLDRTPTSDLEAYDYYLKGRQFLDGRSKEDNAQAEKMLRKAIALDGSYALALIGLAASYLQRVDWWIDADPQWLDQATTLLDRAAALDTTLAELYCESATLSQLRGDYPSAIRLARRAVGMHPFDPQPHYLLAFNLFYDVRSDEADREFRRAIELLPSNPDPYWWRAMIAGLSGRPRDAERLLAKALELAPEAAHIRWFAARFWLARGDQAQALKQIQKAIELRPKTPLFMGWNGVIELWNRQLDAATKHIRDAADESDNPELYHFLGWAYRLNGKSSPSEKAFRNGMRLDQQRLARDSANLEVAYRLLLTRCLTGELKDPGPELDRLAKIGKRTVDPTLRSYFTAAAYTALVDTDRALESIKKVLSSNVYAPSYIAADPRFDGLKDDPRFKKLVGIP